MTILGKQNLAGETALDFLDLAQQGAWVAFPEPPFQTTSVRHFPLDIWAKWMLAVFSILLLAMWLQMPKVMEDPADIRFLRALGPDSSRAGIAGSNVLVEAKKENVAPARVQQVPPPVKETELPFYSELSATGAVPSEESLEERMNRLQREGQAAFIDGNYSRAMTLWKECLVLDPNNPRVSMLIGDVCQRLGDLGQAVSNYSRSLELDPGQVPLAMRRISLLEKLGQSTEAVASLNMYARLFPDDEQIILSQAEWLWHENRGTEAIPLLKHVLELAPGNLEAMALMLHLPINATDFNTYLGMLVSQGASPDRHYELGQLIWKHDLLSQPQASALVHLAGTIAEQSKDERVLSMFNRLKMRTEPVSESFSADKLSDAWLIDGGEFQVQGGRGCLRSDMLHTEATIRLLGSEYLQDTFAEALIESSTGGFWIYMRRTADHFVRFGFDEGGQVHLQVWSHGKLLASQSKPWTMKKIRTRLRLAIRRRGMIGYMDNERLFKIPLEIPAGFGLGWTGMGTFSAERGKAQIIVSRISAGPLMPRLAFIPPIQVDADMDVVLTKLRSESAILTDIAPVWYHVSQDGVWTDQSGSAGKLLKLFGRYARLRLLPVVEIPSQKAIDSASLVAEANRRNLEGFVLLFETMPDKAWREIARRELAGSGLKVILLVMDNAAGTGRMIGLGDESPVSISRKDGVDVLSLPWLGPDGIHKSNAFLPPDKAALLMMDGKN